MARGLPLFNPQLLFASITTASLWLAEKTRTRIEIYLITAGLAIVVLFSVVWVQYQIWAILLISLAGFAYNFYETIR